ncbi:MAG TPA: hypothetical protein VGW75_12370 [Solirubrobacteraceae bacterium]|jgi:hypothetical protein|nr:hypothetical protein [Solirubrobacteraceae bacterium]
MSALRIATLAALAGLSLGAAAAPARADFGVQPGGFSVEVLQDDGSTPETQAGAHPGSLHVHVAFNEKTDPAWGQVPDGDVKDMIVDLPRGIVGNPESMPKCEWGDFNPSSNDAPPECPSSTQVGIAYVNLAALGPTPAAIFNLVPRPGRPAEFGMFVFGARVLMEGNVRSGGDYGLRTTLRSISQVIPMLGADIHLWGVPADPSHDPERAKPGDFFPSGAPAGVEERPFLTNPTECGGEQTATLTYRSWQAPDDWLTAESTLPPITGCDQLEFAPSIAVRPSDRRVDSPTGLDIELTLPQNDDPDGLATAMLRSAVTRLPEGVTISPSAAHGLATCSQAAAGIGTTGPVACPSASKVGDVTIDSPALPEPLTGPIYLGEPAPGVPYRLFLVAQGAGVDIRLAGALTADPATGRLTTRFDDAPQQPFSRLLLHLKGGPQALVATPPGCGTATTTTELGSWGGQSAAPADSFMVEGCDGAPFAPELSAGVTDATAGLSSPFVLRVSRRDGQPGIAGVRNVELPPGLLADLRAIPLCGQDRAAAGTCGAESQIGTLAVAAGSGPSPLRLPGRVYLTTGFDGAPFGLSLVVPAAAGPYDLGTVVVRSALRLRPDGSLTVDSEPFPAILGGIPLRTREVALALDRPGFMLNPTSCAEHRVAATVVSVDGAAAPAATRFQLAGCAGLPFAPRVTASSAGASRSGGAALRVTVQGRRGDANLRTVRMALPRALSARLSTAAAACTAEQYRDDACPRASRVGTASVTTGILPEPLSGPAYLLQSRGGLPTPAARLEGNGIVFSVGGRIELTGGRTVATFDDLPDVPIVDFTLDLPMGSSSALEASRRFCDRPLVASTRIVAQSGRVSRQRTPIAVAGCRPRVAGTAVLGRRATITVAGVGPGVLRAGGRGLRGASRTITRASVARIAVTLTRRSAERVRREGRLRLPVRLSFQPAAGSSARAATLRTAVTFRRR